MRINGMRKELAAILSGIACRRPPALRRSPANDWLYATDLPGLCGENELEEAERRLGEAGWEYRSADGWLTLRKPADIPPDGWYRGPFGPEAGCCRSLLARHPDADPAGSAAVQRRLIKAAEEGEKAYEQACGSLHLEWAVRLRKGERLPKVHPAYFGG